MPQPLGVMHTALYLPSGWIETGHPHLLSQQHFAVLEGGTAVGIEIFVAQLATADETRHQGMLGHLSMHAVQPVDK